MEEGKNVHVPVGSVVVMFGGEIGYFLFFVLAMVRWAMSER